MNHAAATYCHCADTGPQRPDGPWHRAVGWDNRKQTALVQSGELPVSSSLWLTWGKADCVVKEKRHIHLFM